MPINDNTPNGPAALSAPSGNFSAITKSDSTVLSNVPRGLYVGGTGDVTAVAADDASNTSVLFPSVQAGTTLPIRPKKVMSTGTTATGLVGLY